MASVTKSLKEDLDKAMDETPTREITNLRLVSGGMGTNTILYCGDQVVGGVQEISIRITPEGVNEAHITVLGMPTIMNIKVEEAVIEDLTTRESVGRGSLIGDFEDV